MKKNLHNLKDGNSIALGDLINLKGLRKSDAGVRGKLSLDSGNESLSEVAAGLEDNRDITAKDAHSMVGSVKEGVEKMRVDYFGEDLSLEEYNAIEDRENNTKICRDLLAGGNIDMHDSEFREISFLPLAVATKIMFDVNMYLSNLKGIGLKAAEFIIGFSENLSLDGLKNIDLRLAKVLSGSKGNLSLDGLTEISPEVAAELAHHKNADLSLVGITEINPETAKALGGKQGGLQIGLEKMTAEVAEGLAKIGAELIFINLPELNKQTAEKLSGYAGGMLFLDSITQLEEGVAQALSLMPAGSLFLPHLREVNLEDVMFLVRHNGPLDLSGVKRITLEMAREFAKHQGKLDLFGVEGITDEMAEILAEHKLEIRMRGNEAVKLIKFIKIRKEKNAGQK